MNRMLVSAAAAGLCLWAAPSMAQPLSRANPNGAWTIACSAALNERIHKEHPGAERPETIASTLQEWRESEVLMGVRGEGQYLQGRDWVRFDFRCVYNTGSRRVDHLTHSTLGAGAASGPPRTRSSPDAVPSKACWSEIERRVSREKASARIRIVADTFEEWRLPNDERGVAGRGEAQGPDGRWEPFSFECTCEVRSRKVTRADVRW